VISCFLGPLLYHWSFFGERFDVIGRVGLGAFCDWSLGGTALCCDWSRRKGEGLALL